MLDYSLITVGGIVFGTFRNHCLGNILICQMVMGFTHQILSLRTGVRVP